MTEELVTFQTARPAKEKGFDEECMNFFEWYAWTKPMEPIAHARPVFDFREIDSKLTEKAKLRPGLYNTLYQPLKNSTAQPWVYARPTQDLLERWFREKHALMPCQVPIVKDGKIIGFLAAVIPLNKVNVDQKLVPTVYKTFELAREAALQQALKSIPDILNETRHS